VSIRLPPAIERYVKAENSGDVASLSECFAPTATVRDEGRMHRGLAEIQQWKAATASKYQHRMEPLAVVSEGGKTIVISRLTGNFPGSPIELRFAFELDGDRITSLAIGK
jgi:hypothetical protein